MHRSLQRIALAAAAAAVLASTALPAAAQTEIKMTVCSGQAPVLAFVRQISQALIPTVNAELAKTGKLKITWNEAYGGTLAKIGGELEAMESGTCDMGIVGTVFHPAKLPLHQVTFMTPFGPRDQKMVADVMNDMNRNHAGLKAGWEKHNQVFLVGTAIDEYGLFSTFPVTKYEDMAGKKLGSSPAPLLWLRGTGATGVVSGLPSYYNDVKSGVYGGVLTFLSAGVPIKLHEVAPNWIATGMGATFPGALSVNKQAWDKLGPEGQAALRVAADAYTAKYQIEATANLANAENAFKSAGGKFTALSPEERQRWARAIENPAKAWLDKNGEPARAVLKDYMDALRAKGVKFERDWDKE